jgi:hypothetical protein
MEEPENRKVKKPGEDIVFLGLFAARRLAIGNIL